MTFQEHWDEATRGTPWADGVNVTRELANVEELATEPHIPAKMNVFRIFRAFRDPRHQIKVVLLGQDPYPEMLNIGEEVGEQELVPRACGFSFSSPYGKLPLSLRRVFAEILTEYPQPMVERHGGVGGKRALAPRAAIPGDYSGDLSYLIESGVFLLNTFLTIAFNGQKGIPGSHTSWIAFTTQVLNFIRRTCPKAVYLALGKKAADLLKASGVNDAIECDHPANRFGGRNPFCGSGIFLKADALLEKYGIPKVSWVPKKEAVDIGYYDPESTYLPRPQLFGIEEGPPVVVVDEEEPEVEELQRPDAPPVDDDNEESDNGGDEGD